MAQTKCSKYSLFYSKRYQLKQDTSILFFLLKYDILTTNNIKSTVNATWLVCCMEGEKLLNFLYKVPLKTRVKSTNGKVGRKYAKNEQLS